MMDNNIMLMLSTMLAQIVSRRLGLDWSQSSGLTVVFNMILMKLDGTLSALGNHEWRSFGAMFLFSWTWYDLLSWLALLGGLTLGGYHVHRNGWLKQKMVQKQGYLLNLYLKSNMDTFTEYLKKNPSMYSQPDSMDHGDPELLAQSYAQALQTYTGSYNSANGPSKYSQRSMDEIQDRSTFIKPQTDVVIYFQDPNFDISGSYCWRVKHFRVVLLARQTQ